MSPVRIIRFDLGHIRPTSVTRAATIALVLAATLCGCGTADPHSGTLAKEVGHYQLAGVSTADLKARRAEVLKRYGDIQRDVELKAGLPMGVAIKDDRALLGELYREAHDIDRELLRRYSRGDPEITMEQLRASF